MPFNPDWLLRSKAIGLSTVFGEDVNLLKHLGFEMRVKGSHHIFRKSGVEEKPNLQKDGNKAKPYQVRQVRNIIIKYKLGDKG